jgi:WD40 repeat protein
MTEEMVFAAALERSTPAERAAFLDEACAGDPALRARVEALLGSHAHGGSFLQTPAVQRAAEELQGEQGAGATGPEPTAANEDGNCLDFLVPPQKAGSVGRLGHYEVSEVIGRGGMGVVLKAFDDKLHRVVAIKVMAPQLATSATARCRFVREAQAAAAVRNEHVIDIHAVEEANGLPYLVMEYVCGVSLQDRLSRAGSLELKEILRIGMQAAAGLAAAHAQGLVHRDVKPANILLENGVERIKITDFGLARAVDDASLTQSGVVAGTPAYMAPEQARGEAVDHRADLFSLGSVLYALCTGRPPFRASGSLAVLKRVCEEAPRPIREINPEVPGWLVQIITRLHAKDPAQRFASAAEVADVLSKHLARLQQAGGGWRVAGDETPTTRHPLPATRHPSPATRAAAVLVLVLGGLALTEATGVTRVAATVVRIFTPEGTLVVEVNDPNVKVTVEGDGGLAISGAGSQEVRLRPGSYRLRATKDGKSVRDELVTITRGHQQVVKLSVEAAGPGEATPKVQPLAPGEVRRFVGHTLGVNSLAISRDGRHVLSGSGDKTLRLWDVATGKEIRRFEGHTDHVISVTLSPDGRRALSTSDWREQWMRLWNVESGKELHIWHGRWYRRVAFSPEGSRFVTSEGKRGTLRLWDVNSRKELRHFDGHTAIAWSVTFSPDGRKLLSGSEDKTMRLWDVDTGKELQRFGHSDMVYSVCFSPDGGRALSGSLDGLVRLWDLRSGKELRRFEGPGGWVHSVAFSPDGRYALCSGDIVLLLDVETGGVLRGFRGHTSTVHVVAFTPDGRHALSGASNGDNTLRLWELPKLDPPAGPGGKDGPMK